MPVHDWIRVEAGIFHAFHQQWIIAISNALNAGLLPGDYYAMPEQFAGGFGPDVLTLQGDGDSSDDDLAGDEIEREVGTGSTAMLVLRPKMPVTAESDLAFYRRKQTSLVVRHISGDRVVAMVEIVSPGNKSSRSAIRAFIEKAAELLDKRVHLLVIDVLPPGRRDPQGIHAAIWEEVSGEEYERAADKPFTLAAYETALTVRAYVKEIAVGENLVDMPLFLQPDGCVQTPLEATYATAFAAMPRRWRRVLEA